jgi:hypothetical protein
MSAPNEKAAGMLPTSTAATRNTDPPTLLANPKPRNLDVTGFNRLQAKFAKHGRQLQRTRRLQDIHTSYLITFRGDARFFSTMADVRQHLVQIERAP